MHVIQTAECLIGLSRQRTYKLESALTLVNLRIFATKHDIKDQVQLLGASWAINTTQLYYGVGRGLKDGLGISRYNIFIGKIESPLVYQHVATVHHVQYRNYWPMQQ